MGLNYLKLDLEKKYVVSKAINISVNENGALIVYNSLSRPLKEINLDLLLILNTFLKPSTFLEAYNSLTLVYEMKKSDLKTILNQFLNLNILTVEQTEPLKIAPAESGFASLSVHHVMLNDTIRVMAYKTAILNQVKGKSVLDLGCGTGILSIFAAKGGALSVIAIEESRIALTAKKLFKSNKVDSLITLYNANSKDVKLADKVDVIIHEIIGGDPLDENILMYLNDAKNRLLKKGGTFIPNRMEICCVAYEQDFRKHLVSEAKLFGELYGINFDPYIDEVNKMLLNQFNKNVHSNNKEFFGKKILSEEMVLYNMDFNNHGLNGENKSKQSKMKIIHNGIISGFLIYFRAHLDQDVILSTSPHSHTTHWGQKDHPIFPAKTVEVGTTINLTYEIQNINGKQRLDLKLI